MSDKICTYVECEKPLHSRGWCSAHYNNWRRHGNPMAPPRIGPPGLPISRAFEARTERQGMCLVWNGAKNRKGYGILRRNGKDVRMYRWAWEQQNGPIPDGLMIDHICHNPACVDIEHLRLATNQQNQMNRGGPNKGRRHDLPRGVYENRRKGKPYIAVITKNRKYRHLGTFATVEEALTVRRAAEVEMFGQFAGA